jgi:hypothetical protein
MRSTIFTILALLFAPVLSAQVASAPIVDSIVSITFTGGSNYSNETVLFRADGTYQDLSLTSHFSGEGTPTSPPMSGTYTYNVSIGVGWEGPQTVGTITWMNGTTPRSPLTLWFVSSTSGQPGASASGYLSEFEVYPRISITGAANVSNNSWISAAHPTVPGFVIEGSSPRWVLIRGAGPSLVQFGVQNPVANPILSVSFGFSFGINLQPVYSNGVETGQILNSWTSDPNLAPGLSAVFSLVGAFQFTSGSSDCAGLFLLDPGAYIVQGSTSGAEGQLLTEVYVLPYGV